MSCLTSEQQRAMMAELVATIERFHRDALGAPQDYEARRFDEQRNDQLTILLYPVDN
ncbi:hypothetical protein HPA02_26070 [Bisbaumannia pacifica]|uniref:Uncharacterized protein n=1 Tax=Bisbaumannia pacifica TaxID=77098 RepID=A0A510XA79_9GAMM|nr:hypothetical protein [Halomonas pacifica]GEK48324.1 hypothetical protein HPA02_26070 [Halomonas pacifica]